MRRRKVSDSASAGWIWVGTSARFRRQKCGGGSRRAKPWEHLVPAAIAEDVKRIYAGA